MGNERASLVILWDIVHAMAMATVKVDKELVRFQTGWLAAVSLRGLLRQDKHVLENVMVAIKVRFLERSLGSP